jgi:iron complex outermembrane receptor protein
MNPKLDFFKQYVMIKNLLLFLLSFVSSAVLAQSLVTGNILEKDSNIPLMSVNVYVKGGDNGTVTDIDGGYELALNKGTHTLIFSYIGYASIEKIMIVDGFSPVVFDVRLSSEIISNQTIIVTDGKYEKRLEESTVSIDVIGVNELENNNVTSLDELVQKTSGVQVTDGQINIRGGAGYAYGVGSRVIFLTDGQPLLSAELSDVKWNFMPIENAQQIEIIKGSASVLYGSGALNGVINLRTAYPKGDKAYTAFSMYSGVYDQPKIDYMRWYKPEDGLSKMPMFTGLYFAHRQRFNKNFDLVIGGNIHLKNGYIKDVDERRARFNFNSRYRLPKSDGKISVGLNGNLMYHEDGRFFMSLDMIENAYVNISNINRDRYISTTLDPFITAFDQHNNKHDLRARWFRVARAQSGPDSEGNIIGLEYQFQREFSKQFILTAGTCGQYYHVNSILFADINAPSNERALFTANSMAAYAQLDKKFKDIVSLSVGLRWEGYIVNKVFTPTLPILRAGANFTLSDNDYLRLSFGQGFRFPSMAEQFFNEKLPVQGPISIGVFPNVNLLPEIGWSTELGYRRTLNWGGWNFYADIAFFWMEYKNMIEFALDNYPQGFGFSFVNVSEARIAGWEISAKSSGKIGKIPLRIWGGYTYSCPADLSEPSGRMKDAGNYIGFLFKTFVRGLDRNNDVNYLLKYRNLHTFRMDLETEVLGITIGTAVNYTSYMHRIDLIFDFDFISKGVSTYRAGHNTGYWTWDIRLGYNITSKQKINFVIQNALNEEYSPRPAQMGAPRCFSLKYSHIF